MLLKYIIFIHEKNISIPISLYNEYMLTVMTGLSCTLDWVRGYTGLRIHTHDFQCCFLRELTYRQVIQGRQKQKESPQSKQPAHSGSVFLYSSRECTLLPSTATDIQLHLRLFELDLLNSRNFFRAVQYQISWDCKGIQLLGLLRAIIFSVSSMQRQWLLEY